MEKARKCCFMFGNSKIVLSFIKELQERLNTNVTSIIFSERYTIYVASSLYEKALLPVQKY